MSRSILRRQGRARPRRDTEPLRRTATKGILTLLVVGVCVYVGVTSYNGVPGRDYSKLYADVPNVGNLITHDPVRIAGVRVGQVKQVGATESGDARVELQIEPDTDIPVDSDVRVRANGLLGARYVQLIPGGSRRQVADGAILRGAPTALSFGVPEMLDTFDEPTRARLGDMVRELGAGMLGHGAQLNAGLEAVDEAAPQFTRLMRELRTARPGAAERLLPSLDRLMTPLAQASDDLADMLAPGARALQPFVDERAAWRATLDRAPDTLGSATGGLTRGRRLLAAADAVAVAANRTLPTVPAGLRSTTRMLRESPKPLARVTTLLRVAGPAVPAALRITRALDPVLPRMREGLGDLSPILRYVAPRACDIENFGTVMRSMTGFGGVGSGPLGPSMEFRAQVIPVPEAVAPAAEFAQAAKAAYAPPCKFLSKTYPYVADAGGDR